MFFFKKNVKDKAVSLQLDKNMSKDFSRIKIWIKTDHPSQNYGPPNLLYRFTDSYAWYPD